MKQLEVPVIDSAKTIKPFQSSAWRITIFFTVIVTLIISILLAVLYQQLITEQQDQVNQHLSIESQRYYRLAQTVDKATFAIQVQASDPTSTLVAWQTENEVIGALTFMPDNMPLLPLTRDFPILAGGPDKLYLFTGGIIQTDYGTVLIATRTDNLSELIDKFINASISAVMITIILTLAMGHLFSKALLRRLVNYNRLTKKIEQGRYNTRLPVSSRADEFDMLAQQFNIVLDTLEKNLMAIRGVTDNIAHDLRTPLSHLRIGLEQLSQYPPEKIPEQSAILIEKLDHCLMTFNAMLSLTRLEDGQQDLEIEKFNLQSLCVDLNEMAAVLAEDKAQQLTLSLEEDCNITGDKYLLFQALFNLVDNAIKYSGEGSKITIIQKKCQVIIADNGPGIEEKDRSRVFERLVRLDPSRHHQGTGLGLSMVKAILSRHNAKIELLDNKPGLRVIVKFSECIK